MASSCRLHCSIAARLEAAKMANSLYVPPGVHSGTFTGCNSVFSIKIGVLTGSELQPLIKASGNNHVKAVNLFLCVMFGPPDFVHVVNGLLKPLLGLC